MVAQINPYLVDAPTVLVEGRRQPLVPVPRARFGSMPNDNGNLLLNDDEAQAVQAADPAAAPFIREMVSAREMLRGLVGGCLWLADSTAAERRASPEIRRRVEAARLYRLASPRSNTQALAATPSCLKFDNPIPIIVCVPRHAAEGRSIIPMIFLGPQVIAERFDDIDPRC